jgi:hypothetical protein
MYQQHPPHLRSAGDSGLGYPLSNPGILRHQDPRLVQQQQYRPGPRGYEDMYYMPQQQQQQAIYDQNGYYRNPLPVPPPPPGYDGMYPGGQHAGDAMMPPLGYQSAVSQLPGDYYSHDILHDPRGGGIRGGAYPQQPLMNYTPTGMNGINNNGMIQRDYNPSMHYMDQPRDVDRRGMDRGLDVRGQDRVGNNGTGPRYEPRRDDRYESSRDDRSGKIGAGSRGGRDDRDHRRDDRGEQRNGRNDRSDRNGRGGGGHNQSSGTSIVRDPVVEEFRSTYGKSRQWEIRDLAGHVVAFCMDQHGSRFIQQRLEVATESEKQIIFDEVLVTAESLMTDVFGNYVIQKMFEYGAPAQCERLAALLAGQAIGLAMQMYGCRVIQKALEYVSTQRLIILVAEFDTPNVIILVVLSYLTVTNVSYTTYRSWTAFMIKTVIMLSRSVLRL